VESYSTFLDALERPLKYLQQNKYKNLQQVKNLESHVIQSCQKAASHVQNARLKEKLETIQHLFQTFEQKSDADKIRTIEDSLGVLADEKLAISDRFQFKDHEHPALTLAQIQEKIKKLETNVQFLKGVGPVLGEKLRQSAIPTIFDLMNLIPNRYDDRRNIQKIKDLKEGEQATVVGKVLHHGTAFYRGLRKKTYEIVIEDDTGELKLKWFNFFQNTFQKRVQIGKELIVSGKVTSYQKQPAIYHPDFEVFTGEKDSLSFGKIIPVYREVGGMYQKNIRKIVQKALEQYGIHRVCLLPHDICKKFNLLPPWKSLSELHMPSEWIDEAQREQLQRMMAYEELFFYSLALQHRKRNRKEDGIAFTGPSPRYEKLLKNLSFELTSAQKQTLEDLKKDMKSNLPMHRLVQGDVGSGKTIVAFLAAQIAIDHAVQSDGIAKSYQVALIAPSEILCEQHYQNIKQWEELLNIKAVCLLGKQPKKQKQETVDKIASGEAHFVIGTHALLEDTVSFSNLGLVIIDEQHRFGVRQKEKIRGKAKKPDVMIMSATPIPRSLGLTLFGDLDISIMNEMPKGRKPITTYLMREKHRQDVYSRVTKTVEAGQQVFIVYPLVETSEHIEAKDAVSMTEELQKVFPKFKIGLIHGQLIGKEKEAMMADFKNGKIQILVSTTVIEVGIDIPNATLMIIEHPERFGLAQLHQLRGRVGRGSVQSMCILMAPNSVSQTAFDRLKIFSSIYDGFQLAEEDLRIRGPGDFFGVAQSGLPTFSTTQLPRDLDIMEQMRIEALKILQEDPLLKQPAHQHLVWVLQNIWREKLHLPNIA
jgi:ATP-dependent DNA helicase RecG